MISGLMLQKAVVALVEARIKAGLPHGLRASFHGAYEMVAGALVFFPDEVMAFTEDGECDEDDDHEVIRDLQRHLDADPMKHIRKDRVMMDLGDNDEYLLFSKSTNPRTAQHVIYEPAEADVTLEFVNRDDTRWMIVVEGVSFDLLDNMPGAKHAESRAEAHNATRTTDAIPTFLD